MCGRIKLFLFLILASCAKEKNFDEIDVIGHAGMGLDIVNSVYHDNSFEAIEMALSISGCDGVEVDVQRAKDGSLWLYHDEYLSSQTDGEGCIQQSFSAQLASIKYTSIHKERLIRLAELPWERLNGKQLFLDIRHFDPCEEKILDPHEFIASIQQSLPANNAVKIAVVLNRQQWINPFIDAGLQVFFQVYPTEMDMESVIADFPMLTGVIMKNKSCAQSDVQFWKAKGKKVVIFEMRSPKGIREALNKYPDEVLTDDIRATLIEKY